MSYLVRAFPLIRPLAELRKFVAVVAEGQGTEIGRFYRQYGVSHESAYLQETPHGNLLIVVTALEDQRAAAPLYKEASEEFHAWFKAQILHLTGIDPNVTPLGPPTTEVFSWQAESSDAATLRTPGATV